MRRVHEYHCDMCLGDFLDKKRRAIPAEDELEGVYWLSDEHLHAVHKKELKKYIYEGQPGYKHAVAKQLLDRL